MQARQTVLLGKLPDGTFLREVSEGLRLVAEHVETLERSAQALEAQGLWRGMDAIRIVADEEAAKFLILLDAVRCPTREAKRRDVQLKRCHDHLAKGVYVEACDLRPADFAEVQQYANRLRVSFYLDGPNDVDWIFGNVIDRSREERLYVDYVEDDDGASWQSPRDREVVASFLPSRSAASDLVASLTRAGVADARGLAVVAKVWRSFDPDESTRFGEVAARARTALELLEGEGLLAPSWRDTDAATILNSWTFPLHALELTRIEVDPRHLREKQRRWSPR